jgi:hypothetical protein
MVVVVVKWDKVGRRQNAVQEVQTEPVVITMYIIMVGIVDMELLV